MRTDLQILPIKQSGIFPMHFFDRNQLMKISTDTILTDSVDYLAVPFSLIDATETALSDATRFVVPVKRYFQTGHTPVRDVNRIGLA
jgi:hypothetical protein